MLHGQSPIVRKVKKQIRQSAESEDNILLIGEPGSGKEYVAREIHARSKTKDHGFHILNCTALGDTITESDLYGEKTETTKGIERKVGILEKLKKGFLYLENIHETNEDFQKKLTIMIKEGKYRNPKDNSINRIRFRIIAATSIRVLSKMESFRKDLLNLINPITIYIPPLRERKQDLQILFDHFLHNLSLEAGRESPSVPVELFESLIEYDWPGNVSELKNAVKNLFILSPEERLSPEFLPFEIKKHPYEHLVGKKLTEAIEDVEQYIIRRTLQRFSGNQLKTAKMLDVSEATLRYKMKKYGYTRKTF